MIIFKSYLNWVFFFKMSFFIKMELAALRILTTAYTSTRLNFKPLRITFTLYCITGLNHTKQCKYIIIWKI